MPDASQDTPPPVQHIPSAKEKKYDRQLRLWAASGQAALEDAHILLINNGPGVTGIETLKNLILPGIGQFTIQDSAIVSEADLGINFFLDDSSLGKPRAEQTCRYLLELNPDVEGHFITDPLAAWITSANVLQPYTLIVVSSPVAPDVLSHIVRVSQQSGVALFYLHSVGFYSHFSILLPPTFPIVDSHPDPTSTTDLRLLRPWPALAQFAQQKTANLKTLSGFELGHIPFVLLLLCFLDEWRSSHNGESPTSYKDKTAFRDFIRRSSGSLEEENFAEAASAVLKAINPPQVSSSVLAVLQAPEAQHLTSSSPSFWFVASAIHRFYEKYQQLPLPGALPDMKAQSADYIALQNIYKNKAREDCAQVTAIVQSLVHDAGRSTAIPPQEIEQFCKLAAHIKLIRGSSCPFNLAINHLDWSPDSGKAIVNALPNSEFGLENSILVFIAFCAYDHFLASHDADDFNATPRPPGFNDNDVDTDAQKLTGIAFKILDAAINAAGTQVENPQYDNVRQELTGICQELTRAGGAELHNIASLTGGIVSQEIIKVITRQYVPADNTVVYDGVRSMTAVLRI